MKKIVCLLAIVASFICFSACSFLSGNQPKVEYNNDNITKAEEIVSPDDIETSEDVEYYTAKDLELNVEVNGLYKAIRYFSLDPNNNDLRIYDDIYLYKCDFFQMMPKSDTNDISIYASLSDDNDREYVEEHRNSAGGDLQIDVKVEGIYKLIFDLKTLKFDIEYKGEITVPKYYAIETCTLQVKSGDQTIDKPMKLNGDTFFVGNVEIELGSTILFTAINYVSDYKFTLREETENKYACFFMTQEQYKNTYAKVLIGGKYNVSIDAKTYVASLELVSDAEDATYCLKQGTDNLAASAAHPYVFEVSYQAEKDVFMLPSFYNAAFKKVLFKPIDNEFLISTDDGTLFLKKAGNYKLVLNVLDLTIGVEREE